MSHQEADRQICLPVIVGDLGELHLGEIFGVDDIRHLICEETHQALHPRESFTIVIVHVQKSGVPLEMLGHREVLSIIALFMTVKIEAVTVVENWRLVVTE